MHDHKRDFTKIIQRHIQQYDTNLYIIMIIKYTTEWYFQWNHITNASVRGYRDAGEISI